MVLLGTAHISPTSVSDVREVIRTNEPVTSICIELCQERIGGMLESLEGRDVGGGGGGLLGALQRSYAKSFNVTIGCDFMECLEASRGGVRRVFLIDRPISVTMSRAMSSLTTFGRARLAGVLLMDLIISPFRRGKVRKYLEDILREDGESDLLTKVR